MVDVVRLYTGEYMHALGVPNVLVSVRETEPAEGGHFAELFAFVQKLPSRQFDVERVRLHALPLPPEALEAGIQLEPEDVADEGLRIMTGLLRWKQAEALKALRELPIPTDPKMREIDWKTGLFRLRLQGLSSDTFWQIGNVSRSGSLRELVRRLTQVEPFHIEGLSDA